MPRFVALDRRTIRQLQPAAFMKSSDEPEFLDGCTATAAFVNRVLRPAKLYQHRVYRLIEKQRLPAGSSSHPVAIGVRLATLANRRDAGDAK